MLSGTKAVVGKERENCMEVSWATIVSCDAPYGKGGLGRHLVQVVEEYRSARCLERYYAAAVPEGEELGRQVTPRAASWLFQHTPVRFSPAWKILCACEMFDRAVAARLETSKVFHGFDGTSRHTFIRARELRFEQLELEGGMSHICNVERLWTRACRMYPIEQNPLHPALLRRFLAEYETADVIWISSKYSHQRFVEEGVSAAKLRRRCLSLPTRFHPPPKHLDDGVFRVVYIGFLSPAKGTPLLLEAFHHLQGCAELILVGQAWTKNMRRFME